ncbi:MAG: hypothetical protein Q9227_009366 [Pyrenula ochraceoflavens]
MSAPSNQSSSSSPPPTNPLPSSTPFSTAATSINPSILTPTPTTQVDQTPYPTPHLSLTTPILTHPTTATLLTFSDKLLLTITQSGILSQWFEVPLSTPPSYNPSSDSETSALPDTHLTPRAILGGGKGARETRGMVYAAKIGSLVKERRREKGGEEEGRVLVVGFGFVGRGKREGDEVEEEEERREREEYEGVVGLVGRLLDGGG